MKKHLLKLKITHGEYQFDQSVILSVPEHNSPEDAANSYARTFYGVPCSGDNDPDSGFFFNRGEIHVAVQSVTEISDSDAQVLGRFL